MAFFWYKFVLKGLMMFYFSPSYVSKNTAMIMLPVLLIHGSITFVKIQVLILL